MSLAELQENFQAYLLAEDVDNTQQPILAMLVGDELVGVHQRLNIYHHAYRARMQEAMATAYPNLQHYLGCQQFNQLVIAFMAQAPSTYRNLRWVGGVMADYLAQTMPEHVLLSDLARFEWALSLAFDAEDQATLTVVDLSQIPPDRWSQLRFDFHAAVQVHEASTQVIPAWQALDAGKVPHVIEENTSYVVWRQDMLSYFKTLEAHEKLAIEFMQKGHTFGELCEALAGVSGEEQAVSVAANFLSEWLNAGMILKSSLNK